MAIPLFQVDAFSDRPFGGNPAAICLLEEPRADRWLQQFTQEMNLSETAYLLKQHDGYGLRWFTPALEVDLCGHATLASAHVLYEEGLVPLDDAIRFHTRSGVLTATMRDDLIWLDFPARPVNAVTPPPALLAALGVKPAWSGITGGGDALHRNFLLELESEQAVRAVRPDFRAISEATNSGVMVTSRAESPGHDFVSRYFAPYAGIDEDPVTGSAHCTLAPYWSAKLGRLDLVGFQASARGGTVRVRSLGARVQLGGTAVTVLRGMVA